MGGTFDPIHYGHLVTAEEALVQFNLDRVVFMPTGRPAAKVDREVTTAEHRYLMAVIATSSNPDFEVSRMEVDRPGLTYTVETLEAMRARHGGQTEIFFITGADAVWEILTWKDPERVADLCTFIAATRPGYEFAQPSEEEKDLLKKARVEYMEVPALAISSTDIRRRVAANLPIRYLLPEGVAAYIRKTGLYASGV